ncbi:CLUMA_CG007556, isoform A [Clunio marinus]|uniref:E3 SUMO-protein ligase NSE2 n=1 Tax=Clunio marinus TaxID=568069 RepID=A0A1J1I124_9DIPT|nr:CLUMA_CG007556, isoform A [Clunio marinus]
MDIPAHVDKTLSSLLNVYSIVCKENPEYASLCVPTIKNLVEEVCKLEKEASLFKDQTENASSSVIVSGKETDRFKQFGEDLENIYLTMNTESDERTMNGENSMEENPTIYDPITKNPIADPVRNVICKHVYDKISITAAITQNKLHRCPYIGCVNKRMSLSNLKPDNDLKRKIMSSQADIDLI